MSSSHLPLQRPVGIETLRFVTFCQMTEKITKERGQKQKHKKAGNKHNLQENEKIEIVKSVLCLMLLLL